MSHHFWVNGVVDTRKVWGDCYGIPSKVYGYSPQDSSVPWFMVDRYIPDGWVRRTKADMPKEFLAQLLLLGIPIRD